MHRILLLTILLCFSGLLRAEGFYRGYLLTKSGMELTGYIGAVTYGQVTPSVVFVNDFGTSYSIHPALVKGFVYVNEKEVVSYQSFYYEDEWHFLQVLSQGDYMTLYQAPVQRTTLTIENGQLAHDQYRQQEYFLQSRSGRILRIRRMSFRKKLKAAFKHTAPELAQKIGRPGYRFRDMNAIVEEYNVLCQQTRL